MKLAVLLVLGILSRTVSWAEDNAKPAISIEQARNTALKTFQGSIESEELETEGRLLYSFDIRGKNRSLHEVQVDAQTGKVLTNKTETPQQEAAEQKADAAGQAHPGYHVIKKVVLGGDGGWDYLTLDSAAHRLFISRGTHVMVVDPQTGRMIGDISGTEGVHGIALAPELAKGFTSNGRASTVAVFDLATLAVKDQVKVGNGPDAILYEPSNARVITFNGHGEDATVIDARTDKVIGTIALGGRPEFAATDGHGAVFVNLEDKSELLKLDVSGLKVSARWPLAPCVEPSGLAMDVEHNRLFAGCSNRLMAVVNAQTGQLVQTVPIGDHVDANGFDPGSQLAFSSNGDGTLTVVHEDSPDKFTVTDNVPTQKGARTLALDPATHQIYLVTADFGAPVKDLASGRIRPAIVPGTFVLLTLGL